MLSCKSKKPKERRKKKFPSGFEQNRGGAALLEEFAQRCA